MQKPNFDVYSPKLARLNVVDSFHGNMDQKPSINLYCFINWVGFECGLNPMLKNSSVNAIKTPVIYTVQNNRKFLLFYGYSFVNLISWLNHLPGYTVDCLDYFRAFFVNSKQIRVLTLMYFFLLYLYIMLVVNQY